MKKSEIKELSNKDLLYCTLVTSDHLTFEYTDRMMKEWHWMIEELTKRLGVNFEEFMKMM